jgi:hypothetical protein
MKVQSLLSVLPVIAATLSFARPLMAQQAIPVTVGIVGTVDVQQLPSPTQVATDPNIPHGTAESDEFLPKEHPDKQAALTLGNNAAGLTRPCGTCSGEPPSRDTPPS